MNGGCLSRRDRALTLIQPYVAFRVNATRVARQFEAFSAATPVHVHQPISVRVEAYEGRDPHVLQMMDYVAKHLRDDVLGVYVHGSLGTYEAIPYSDFDALVILKDEVFSSPYRLARTARKLDKARTIMLQFDPLQHHGWFVLTEAQLRSYPEFYFPSILLGHSKALLPEQGRDLKLWPVEAMDLQKRVFMNLSGSVIAKIECGSFPTTLYELKLLLSQFMLLPAIYVQVRDCCGVYKKYSFERAKGDFAEEDWRVMEKVSAIRENWQPEMHRAQRWLLTRRSSGLRHLTKRFAPVVPRSLRSVLTQDFYKQMQKLAQLMRERLQQVQPEGQQI